MRNKIVVALAAAAAALLVATPPAQAGGWAASGLDAVPAPVAGEPVDVGFTIRSHGMVPVSVEGPVSIEVRSSDGNSWQNAFPAVPDGPEGHYVAQVTFPFEGSFTWLVNQGLLYGPYELGPVDAGPPTGTPASPAPPARPDPGTEPPTALAPPVVQTERAAPTWLRVVLPLALLGGLGLLVLDRRAARPVRQTVPAAAASA